MNALQLTLVLQLAALSHVGLLTAGACMPKVVGLGRHLADVPPFIRRLFFVYYGFIGMILMGFGVLTFAFADAMAAGQPVARALCVLMALFWSMRLAVGWLVFDLRPYLTNVFYRLGSAALNLVFVYLVAAYWFAAWKGGRL
jgi:hypothetical protein